MKVTLSSRFDSYPILPYGGQVSMDNLTNNEITIAVDPIIEQLISNMRVNGLSRLWLATSQGVFMAWIDDDTHGEVKLYLPKRNYFYNPKP